jgi:hypothetical protein
VSCRTPKRYLVTIILLAAFTTEIGAQRRPAGEAQVKQAIQVSLKVGGQTYHSSEPGSCTHAPVASIYQIMSEMWSVQQSQQAGSLSLSFWRPKDGSADMMTLSVSTGDSSHEVNTVRGGRTTSGSGKVTLAKSGNGGTFTVEAKSKDGAPITGTITCKTFAPHAAEGGL